MRNATQDTVQPRVQSQGTSLWQCRKCLTLYRTVEEATTCVCEPAKPSALNVQAGGQHYRHRAIQPVEYIHANELGFLEGCIIKRITRWRDKPAATRFEDLEKIKHEIDLLIELESRGD